MTWRATQGKAPPGAAPVSESDALRMSEDNWAILRPLIVAELEAQRGVDVESTLHTQWCSLQMSVFERSWQRDNMAALERGTLEDYTGNPYMLGWNLSFRECTTDDVTRVCLHCGKKGGTELMGCGRCSNAYFCNVDCQKAEWSDRKKECKKYERGGRSEWSNQS